MIGHVGGDPRKALKAAQWVLGGCLVVLTLLALPTAAKAQCQPLPGRSALDQYCESVPGAGGDKAAGKGGGGRSGRAGRGGSGGGSDLPPGVANRLRGAGPSGEALLDYAQSSAAGGSGRSGGKNGRGEAGRDGTKGPEADTSDNPLSAIKNAVSSGPSAGQAFVWILIAIALIVAALGWLRYRARHGAGAE